MPVRPPSSSKLMSSSETEWPPGAAEHSPVTPPASGDLGSPRHPARLRRRVQTAASQKLLFNCLSKVTPRSPADLPRSRSSSSSGALRRLFTNSVDEREIKLDHHGRQVSEIDALTFKYETEFRQLVPIVADVLQLATQTSQLPTGAPQDAQFQSYNTPAVPNISLEGYIMRVAQNAFVSPASMVVALMFLDRMMNYHPRLAIVPLNVYKLFFVACRVASKVTEIRTLNNKNFAPIGGVDLAQLNALEAMFLTDIKFELYVDPKEFSVYATEVLRASCFGASVERPRMMITEKGRVMSVKSDNEASSPHRAQ